MIKSGIWPVHPGEVLREDYMAPRAGEGSERADAPDQRCRARASRRIPDTAMRLARYFGGDVRSWLNLQSAYDLRVAEVANAKRIEREIRPAAA